MATERDYARLAIELQIALELLGRCQDTRQLPDELHDDISRAAIHYGWWCSASQAH